MSEDKSIEVIEKALVALSAIADSNEFAKHTTESDGSPLGSHSQIEVIISIAEEAVELLSGYLEDK